MALILIMTQIAAYLWPECIAVKALTTYFNAFMLGDFSKGRHLYSMINNPYANWLVT